MPGSFQGSTPQPDFFGQDNLSPTAWIISHVVVTPSPSGGPAIGGPPNGGAPPLVGSHNVINTMPLITVLCSVGMVFLVAVVVGVVIAFRSNAYGGGDSDYFDEEEGRSFPETTSNGQSLERRYPGGLAPHTASLLRLDNRASMANGGRPEGSSSSSPGMAEAPALNRTLSNQSPTNHAEAPNAMYTPREADPSTSHNKFEKWLASPSPSPSKEQSMPLLAHIGDAMPVEDVLVIVAEDQIEAPSLPDKPEPSVVSRGLNKRTLTGVLV